MIEKCFKITIPANSASRLAHYLEGVVELDDPLVLGLGQDVLLGDDVRHLLPLDHLALPQRLHGVQPAGLRTVDQGSNEADFAERAQADGLDLLEVAAVQLGALHAEVVGLLPPQDHPHLLAQVRILDLKLKTRQIFSIDITVTKEKP